MKHEKLDECWKNGCSGSDDGSGNELIAAKAVPDYAVTIPEGRVLSRLEMAMIVDAAMKNQANMTDAQQESLNKLNSEYYYDIKKLTLLNRLDNLDKAQMDKLNKQQEGETFTLNEKFLRLGVSYVPYKNILLDTFYTWGRDIDTGARDDMYRFQAQFFF